MMVATDFIHGSIFAVVARRKGGQDDYVMLSFQNYIDRVGLVKAELKCDQEPITLDVANALIKRCQSTALIVTATPRGSKGSLGRGERANLTADVRKGCTCDRTFWTSTDVLQDAQVVLGLDNTEECRARSEQEMVDKGDAIKIESGGRNCARA